ncbi:MAG: AMP-binding protein [Bacteroidaceae bacterium]|nr:AMP-binding protein [Bacteroidaceae bacterium]
MGHDYIQKETSILKIVENVIKRNWDNNSMSDYGTSVDYKYGDVAEMIVFLHGVYEAAGIKPGDKIAICEKNCSNWCVAFLSIVTYGAVAVPILYDFNGEQIDNIIAHSESKLLLCGKATKERLTQTDADIMIDIAVWNSFDGKDSVIGKIFAAAEAAFNKKYPYGVKPEHIEFRREDPESLALLSYTSGSTGNSKGVMLPYRSLWSNVLFADEKLYMPEGSRILSLLPLAHMYGFSFEFLYEFCIGCHLNFLTRVPSPAVIMGALASVRPNVIIAVPLIIEKVVRGKVFPLLKKKSMSILLKIPGINNIIYNSIRKKLYTAFGGAHYEIVVGGAAFSQDVEAFLRRIKYPYTVGYGMTEAAPLMAYEGWQKFIPKSCGKAIDFVKVRIDSEDPYNIVGEIQAKGVNIMSGYYKNEEATKAAFTEDGWMNTGDLGLMDKEGNIFIKGRSKNMILSPNGQNIYPEEIEAVINNQPYIVESIVVSRGAALVGLVYMDSEKIAQEGINTEEYSKSLIKEVNAKMPAYSKISAIEIAETPLEKTPKMSIKRFLYS